MCDKFGVIRRLKNHGAPLSSAEAPVSKHQRKERERERWREKTEARGTIVNTRERNGSGSAGERKRGRRPLRRREMERYTFT